MVYNPYTGNYDQYGLGPQYRFFSADPLDTTSTAPPTTDPNGTLPPLPELPTLTTDASGGGGAGDTGGSGGPAGGGAPANGPSGFSDLYGGLVTDTSRAPSMSNLGVSPTMGALASAMVPGLGWASTAANTANTALNASDLASMGYGMTPGQMLGGAFGVNGYSGALSDAMGAAMANDAGRAALSGKGPSSADIAAMNENYASSISDRDMAPADAPTNTNDTSLGTSPNAPNGPSPETQGLGDISGFSGGVSGEGFNGPGGGFEGGSEAGSAAESNAGDRYARGGLARAAQQVAGAGRGGDTQIVHLGPAEVKILEEIFGPGTRNPHTGMQEHFDFGNFLKSVIPTVAGIVTRAVTGGNDLAGAAVTGIASKVLGGSTTDALTNAALQYGGGKLAQGLGGPGSFMDNITGPVTDFNNLGTGPLQDAISGGGYNPSSIPLPQEKPPVPGSEGYGTNAPSDGASSVYQPEGGVSGLLGIAKNAAISTPSLLAIGAGALSTANKPADAATAPGASPSSKGPDNPYSSDPLQRDQNTYGDDYYTYGLRPQFSFFTPVNAPPKMKAARGGLAAGGGALTGTTKGQADKVPAELSDGEFVIPADVVADLGDGNNEAGADELYGLMSAVRSHKAVKGHPPKAKSISAYLQERRP